MATRDSFLETPDQRNECLRHLHHRHTARARRRMRRTASQRPPVPSEQVPSLPRLHKCEHLIDGAVDDYLEVLFYPPYESIEHWKDKYYNRPDYYNPVEGFWSLNIRRALEDKHADLLALLIGQHRVNKHLTGYSSSYVRPDSLRKRSRHTMLTHAIALGDAECIDVLLDNICAGHLYPTIVDHVCVGGRTALWYACKKGDLSLVRELVESTRATINKCGILIVAVQNGHPRVVEYLLKKGADPNRHVKNYNETALHAAVRRNRLDLVQLLLQYGANPTRLDRSKRTPLDYAVHKRYIDIAKLLIEHHTDRRFIMSQTGFTPLMLAADCVNTPVVATLTDILSEQQVLDELTLLACRYTIDGNASKRDVAYAYFEKALSRTTPTGQIPPCKVYEYMSECRSLDELAAIRNDENKLRLYALMVAERLLARNGEIKHLLWLITKQSDFYRWRGQLERCLELRVYVYRWFVRTEDKHQSDDKQHAIYLSAMVNVLYKILKKEEMVSMQSLALVWSWILNREKSKLAGLLLKLLIMIIYLMENKRLNSGDQCILWNCVRRGVRAKFLTGVDLPLLHPFLRYSSRGLGAYQCLQTPIPSSSVIRLLIHAGADVNEVDPRSRSTILHLAVSHHDLAERRRLVQLLLDAGAHSDSVNLNNDDDETSALLRAKKSLSLRCRCAQLINEQQISYENCLPDQLVRFVRLHDSH